MSHEFLDLILALAIIITAAKTGGFISTRLKQPSVLGELLAGILLGPTMLDLLHQGSFAHDAHLGESVNMMAEIGVILLMLLAGLELHLGDLLKSGKVSAIAGTMGVFLPLGLGMATAVAFGAEMEVAIFIGLTLSATSVSISAQTLLELGVLRTRVGLAMLGAAVFDDILVILILSITFLLVSGTGGGVMAIVTTLGLMIGYLVVASLFGRFLLPTLTTLINRLPASQGTLAFVLVVTLLYAWAAEVVGGMAAITGAFLVGLFLANLPFKERLEEGIIALAYGFFVPIFFVNIGLQVDLLSLSGAGWIYALVLTAVAVASKVVGAGLGGKWGGLTNRESLQLGIGMVSRGEVGLIVAAFALAEGLITNDVFAIIVFMVIVATLLTPPLLRLSFAPPRKKQKQTVSPSDPSPYTPDTPKSDQEADGVVTNNGNSVDSNGYVNQTKEPLQEE